MSLLQESTPDLFLLDINLPECNGNGLLQWIRQFPSLAQVLAIAMSADALPDSIAFTMASGFRDYWVKPISLRWVTASIDKAFDETDAIGAGARTTPAHTLAAARLN